jgi:uncharacterized Zn finger protein
MSFYSSFPPYQSVYQQKIQNESDFKKLQKKNKDNNFEPIVIEGQTLAKNWWGKSWNKNIERYADYSNRLSRGKRYLRVGSVFDLKISKGKITGIVGGSSYKPYNILIEIKSIDENKWNKIIGKSIGSIESLNELLMGDFSKELEDVFFKEDEGLFPTPKEIKLKCSCPDVAQMCKHVSSILYGVGVKLDKSPELLFELRGIDVNKLISETLGQNVDSLLEKSKNVTERVIDNVDILSLFEI